MGGCVLCDYFVSFFRGRCQRCGSRALCVAPALFLLLNFMVADNVILFPGQIPVRDVGYESRAWHNCEAWHDETIFCFGLECVLFCGQLFVGSGSFQCFDQLLVVFAVILFLPPFLFECSWVENLTDRVFG